jgi:hypothetical protein
MIFIESLISKTADNTVQYKVWVISPHDRVTDWGLWFCHCSEWGWNIILHITTPGEDQNPSMDENSKYGCYGMVVSFTPF